MPSLPYRTATDLVRALRAGELSSAGVLDALLERVEARDGDLNAVVCRDVEGARERAAAADAARGRGESWGPLHGLPMTIKDSIEVAGMPATSGAPELAEHRPARHADAVQRLVDAGAVVFGKTNLPYMAGDFQSYNAVYGTTNNPWDVTRSPGGSSGGAAAALAAGFTPLELGSDIGGSIRNPSHYCGVFGHKPSLGVVPDRGHIPGPPGVLARPDLAVLGPMARCADDLSLGLDVLAAPQGEDAKAWQLALPPPRHTRLGDFRIGLWLEQPGRTVAAAVGDRIQAATDALAAAGAKVDEKARPAFDPEDSHARYLRLLYGVMGAGFPPEILAGLDAGYAELDDAASGRGAEMVRGCAAPHRRWLVDNEVRHHIRAAWAAFFEDFDALLCPVMPTAANPHDHSPIESRTVEIDGLTCDYLDQVFWAGLATLAYLPSTVVPVGRTPEGLPVGMQITAPYLEDRTSIELARLCEATLGGFEAPPGFGG